MKKKLAFYIKKGVKKLGNIIIGLRFIKLIFRILGIRLSKIQSPDDIDFYKKFFPEDSIINKKFYNVCAGGHISFGGGFWHPLWRNLDVMNPQKNWGNTFIASKDIIYDMLNMEPLPIESNSAEIIQCQYSIEHVNDKAAAFFFKEVYRVLKPGGLFKIVTPNATLDYLAYNNNDKLYFDWLDIHSSKEMVENQGYKKPLREVSFEQVVMAHFAASVSENHIGNNPQVISDAEFRKVMSTQKMEDALEYCTSKCDPEIQKKFRYNHMNWWNHDKVQQFLSKAGFNKIYIMAPGQSNSPVLRNSANFDNLWNFVALFMEAKKE